jgi:transposase
VEAVGVDETSSRKGHKYITVFADMKTGDAIFATEGKGADTLGEFARDLAAHKGNPQKIGEIAMDMSPSFISGAASHLPNAQITFDKFHVAEIVNDAVDKVRREEQKINPLLKKTRYLRLSNPASLSAKQQAALSSLAKESLQTGKAYKIKTTLQDIYRLITDPSDAEKALKQWVRMASRSKLEPMAEAAATIKAHLDGILRHFTSGLTSGLMEGINSRIQEVKRRAKGYRNPKNFITMVYLVAGGIGF